MSVSVLSGWASNNPPTELAYKLHKAVQAWSDETGHVIRDALKAETPVRTGTLRGSERYTRTFPGDTVRLEFTAHTPYAPYVIDGTRPHEIWATSARALRWTGPGGVHFAKHVHHPGTAPNDFPGRVLDEFRDQVITDLVEKIQDALN